jgi:hypothetical protein
MQGVITIVHRLIILLWDQIYNEQYPSENSVHFYTMPILYFIKLNMLFVLKKGGPDDGVF